MNFLFAIPPWGVALAGLVPAGIFALYFLKLKRKPMQVPSTFLWKKSIEDLHVNSFWQRLRRNVLLWLQLLAAFLMLFALAHLVSNRTDTGRRTILMIDNSASMAAAEEGGTRLQLAKAKAAEVLTQLVDGDSAMVISFSDAGKTVLPYTTNLGQVRAALDRIGQTDRPTAIGEALAIASGLANPQRAGEDDAEALPATLYVFSDGGFAPVPDFSPGNLAVRYVRVGTPRDNFGIVAMASRRSESDPDRLEVLATVRNDAAGPRETVVELAADGRTLDYKKVAVDAGEQRSVAFQLQAPERVTLSTSLDADEALTTDNRAYNIVQPPKQVKVMVVGDDNIALRAALTTEEAVRVADVDYRPAATADREMDSDLDFARYDLIVFDRCAPRSLPDCNTFFIGALPPTLAGAERRDIELPLILDWDNTHPVLRFLALDNIRIAGAFTIDLPPGAARLILGSGAETLLFTVPRGIRTDLVQTFPIITADGANTDWPWKLSFPMYLYNVIRTLTGAEDRGQLTTLAGQPITLALGELEQLGTLTRPDGTTDAVKRSSRGTFEILDTGRTGLYELEVGDETATFAVNLFDPRESNLLPATELPIGETEVKDVSSEVEGRFEWWKPAVLLVLALLMLEWFVYNRRVYV